MSDEYEEFDDEDVVGAEDEVDEDELKQAARAAGAITDSPDIDSPGDAEGSQLPDQGAAPVPQAPNLAEILAGTVPTFFLHKSYQQVPPQVEALGVARRVTQGRVGLGAIVRLPSMKTTAAATFLNNCSSAAIHLADPEIYTIDGSGSPIRPSSQRSLGYHPWLSAIPTAGPGTQRRHQWISQVFDEQYAAGANLLLSASGWVSDQQGQVSLQAAMTWVSDSRAVLASDDPMFVNLTLPSSWLGNRALRNLLLDEIVESNERHWYLRFYWPIVDPSYGQLSDNAILAGYRELAQIARGEGKVLVLPNSGLTGWVATALGASGFSTGLSWPEQAFAAERIMRSRPDQPRPAAVPRYFDRHVLHPLDWSASQAMNGLPGHTTCSCRFCIRMRNAGAWDKGAASAHYLVRAARLTAEIATNNRRREARRIVQNAQQFAASLNGTQHALTGRYAPRHLAEWAQLL